jgi:Pyruvate/2-oxoacid:ferredoxin oxidoreductase delta subunit
MAMAYDNLLLIYYSGTGNSKRVSEWITDEAQRQGMKTHISSFENFDPAQVAGFSGRTLVGFFSATHGFNMPHSMLAFLMHFRQFRGADVFVGNTRAGMKAGKLFLPGLSGIALFFPALILLLKGYRIRALYPVDLPSNWISLHPGLRTRVVESMCSHYETLSRSFAVKVLHRESVFMKSLVMLPLDLLVMPVALAYYLIGRFILAKTFVAGSACTLCGKCVEQCPTRSVVMRSNRPYWKFGCESCMRCMNNCPERAIETAHSLLILILLLLSWAVNPLIFGLLEGLTASRPALSAAVTELLKAGSALLVFYLSYRLLHWLLRFPLVNALVVNTSLTHLKLWRRYRIPGRKKPAEGH